MERKIAKRMVRKDGTVSARYETVVADVLRRIALDKSARFHCKAWYGSPHYLRVDDEEYKYCDVLDALGISYTKGNDSPRFSVVGDYLEAKFDKRNKAVALIKAKRDELVREYADGYYGVNTYACVEVFNQIIRG